MVLQSQTQRGTRRSAAVMTSMTSMTSMMAVLTAFSLVVAAAVVSSVHAAETESPGTEDLTVMWDLPRCIEPRKKFVYIKTHKTGSSTIANIFHRFANKHGLHLALPKDDTFYSWPYLGKTQILNSIWNYNPPKTYDGLCSAHVRYSPEALGTLVPNAAYVTVLRSPITHAKSSWSYWGFAKNIISHGGPSLTLDEFMEDPDKYFRFAERTLLQNSQAFDLGLTNEPSKSQVEDLINTLEKRFFVLITDHMDESLVMMKRVFCWDTEDILYMSLKKTRRPRPQEDSETVRLRNERIRKMSWADQMLFDHFNQTLFRLIEEEPGFHDELKYFRERKARMSEICRLHARMDGRLHRARIEEKRDIGEQDRMCHLVLLESQGFSKHFKWREGGDPIDIECRTQGYPHKTAVLARIDGVADGVVANLLLNTGIHHDLALSIPRSPITEGRTDVRAQFLTPKSRGGRNPAPINVLIGRTDAVLNMTTAAKFTAPNPKSFALVRDPAARFVDLWRELGMDAMLDGATMEDYLSDPNAFRNSMPEAARLRLHEGMARSLGYTGDVDTNMPIGKAQRAATSVARGFTLGLIAEHWFESLVYLRRLLCWSQREVEYIAHPSNPNAPAGAAVDVMFGPPQTAISDELRSKILAVNRVDAALYKHFNTTLWRGLEREAQMREEIDMTKAHLQHVLDTCEPLLHMMEAEIAELAENGSGSERRCARMLVPVDVLSRIAQKRKSSRWSYE